MRLMWLADRSGACWRGAWPRVVLLLGATLTTGRAAAQVPWSANVADAEDFRAPSANPAVLPFVPPHVAVGGEVFHVGAEDNGFGLNRGHLSIASPSRLPGFGLSVRYLRTPRFSDSILQLHGGRRLWRGLALGVAIGMRQLHYDVGEFNLDNPADPLLALGDSKLVPTVAIGGFAHLGRGLAVGASVEDLNRPNLGLNPSSTYRQPLALNAGAKLYLGALRLTAGARAVDGRVSWSAGGERWFQDERAMLRVLALPQQAAAEGALEILPGLALDYRYTYPWNDLRGASSGTHQMTLIARLGRLPELPPLRSLSDQQPEIEPRGLVPSPPPYRAELPRFATRIAKRPYDPEDLVALLSNPDSLLETRYVIERQVDSLVTAEEIQSLPAFLLGLADSTRCEPYDLRTEPTAVVGLAGPVDPRRVYSPEYQKKLQTLLRLSAGDSTRLEVVSSPGAERRLGEVTELARQTAGRLSLRLPVFESAADSLAWQRPRGRLDAQSVCTALSSPSIRFLLTWPQGVAWASWRLEIRDSDDELFHVLQSEGAPPRELTWNWRNERGELPAPDYYLCRLRWRTDREGAYRSSNFRVLYVSQRRIQNVFHIEPFRPESLTPGERKELILRP